MKTAYSYQRFSSIKQKEGDSTRRQTEAVPRFCQEHNLKLADTFRDEGISAFKGGNFAPETALGEFMRLIDRGTIKPGSVLIVENLDRLSRASIMPCLTKFNEIITKGVSIGVISQNRIYDLKSVTDNPFELIFVLVEFMRANSESQAKSTRSKAVIQAKIAKIKNGEKVWLQVQKPSWVIGMQDGKFVMDDDRVSLVKRIFRLYLAGNSCSHIAATLNQEHVRTLRQLKHGMWTNSTVRELLKNKNVIGWYQINGVEIDNYLPAIISSADFEQVQTRLVANRLNRGGSKYGFVRNLFKGLLCCAECGQTVETRINGYRNVKGEINHYTDYLCRGVRGKTGCGNKGRVSVGMVEVAIFNNVLFRHPEYLAKPTSLDDNDIADLKIKLAQVQTAIDRLTDYASDPDLQGEASIKVKLKKAITDKEVLQKEIDAKAAKMTQIRALPDNIKSIWNAFGGDKVSVLKKAKEWTDHYNAYMKDTERRKKLRSLRMTSIDLVDTKILWSI